MFSTIHDGEHFFNLLDSATETYTISRSFVQEFFMSQLVHKVWEDKFLTCGLVCGQFRCTPYAIQKQVYMARESTQHKLDRVRSPRVHITYDVEVGNAIEMKELPFVMGVLGDLTGQPENPLAALKDRKFVEINPDNFDSVLKGMAAAPGLFGREQAERRPERRTGRASTCTSKASTTSRRKT